MNFQIQTIPHKSQRYPTVGDYWTDEAGVQQVRVSEMGSKKYEFLVAVHELIEAFLTQDCGIHEEDISRFDQAFEKEREAGIWSLDDEPGNDPRAPYRKEHVLAEIVERLLASELNVDWQEYERTITNL